MYLYPDNLSGKPTLFFWQLKDLGIILLLVLLGIFVAANTGSVFLLVGAFVYAFLTIRASEVSILDFLKYAAAYFFYKPQRYEWKEGKE